MSSVCCSRLLKGPEGGAEASLARAQEALEEHGEGFSVTATRGSVLLPAEAEDSSEALRIADGRMYARKSLNRDSAGRQSTNVLLRVLAERYPELGDHVGKVAKLSEQVAGHLALSEEETGSVVQAAALHDIGKAAVPDAILAKPGPLDESEWQFIRQHPLIGERILAAAPALAKSARFVRWSHERIDGNGYPDGLEGDEIPIGARIIAVCDAYDAMTSTRPYKPTPMSPETALAELRSSAGTQFDPEVVEAFAAVLRDPVSSGERDESPVTSH
jgi:two-component system, cell cycle response regulator